MMTVLLGLAAGIAVLIVVFLILGARKKKAEAAAAMPTPAPTATGTDDGKKEKEKEDYALKKFRSGLTARMRNVIILTLLLVGSIAWAVLSVHKVRHQHTLLDAEKEQVLRERDSTFTLTLEEPKVREKLARTQEEAALNNKVMMFADNSTKSLEYFFDLADLYTDPLVFDFGQSQSGIVKTDKDVTYNTYVLTGKGKYNQIFNFLNELEVQPPFYSIESVALNMKGPEEEGTVEYSVEVRAYSTPKGTSINQIPLLPVKNRNLRYNPFYPGIHEPIKYEDAQFLSLLDVEDGRLIALTRDRAFVRTSSTGVIRMLSIGDPVRYGILKRIDWDNQQAVFEVNRYGVAEPYRMTLDGAIQTHPSQEYEEEE